MLRPATSPSSPELAVVRLSLGTVLLQWATGGLLAGWVTTRHRVLGTGYGWLVRGSFLVLALGGVAAGLADDDGGTGATVRDAAGLAMAVAAALALTVSVVRRRAPVGDRATGFPPALDLVAPAAGLVALLGAADATGGSYALSAARLCVGAVFLGVVTDAMLLGHWYLVQPGLSREPIKELVRLVLVITPFEVALLLVPTGMVSVLDGTIDDGYGGILGAMWAVGAVTTIGLAFAARRALREPYYSAVMATTGLLYLAILTAFGTDVLARALLAS
jgi:hypothetical protein